MEVPSARRTHAGRAAQFAKGRRGARTVALPNPPSLEGETGLELTGNIDATV